METHRSHLLSSTPSPDADPSTYIWTLYFLAQHFSHISQHDKAIDYLDEALSHTPTLPDLLMLKARILKRQADPYGAARWMDEARLLDLQDRFLNTKCGVYRLRAGLTEEAQDVLGLFTKVSERVFARLIDLFVSRLSSLSERCAEPWCRSRGYAIRLVLG